MILIGELRSWDRTGTVGNLTHRAADHIEQAENDRRKGVEYIARLEGALREAQETIIKQGNELARRTSVETDGPCQACGGIGCKHCSAVETTGERTKVPHVTAIEAFCLCAGCVKLRSGE
jgi:hypothetical protein